MLFDAFVNKKFNEWSLSAVDGDKQRGMKLGRRHLHVRFTLQIHHRWAPSLQQEGGQDNA